MYMYVYDPTENTRLLCIHPLSIRTAPQAESRRGGGADPDPSDFVENNSQAIYNSTPWLVCALCERVWTHAHTHTKQGFTCFTHKI